jgi:sulfatase modifying factor 1
MRHGFISIILLCAISSLSCKKDDNPLTPTVDSTPQGMVTVTGGNFTFGLYKVTISSLYMDKYEVTYQQWGVIRDWASSHGYTDISLGGGGYNPRGGINPSAPVIDLYWYDMVKWCNARSENEGLSPVYYTDSTQSTIYKTGKVDITNTCAKWSANGYRLPTEAEWQFAAQGGTKSKGFTYSGANSFDSVGWYKGNLGDSTHTVGQKAPNELGIYDMTGNVAESCWDMWSDFPISSNTVDPKGASTWQGYQYRVLRGGSYDVATSNCPATLRTGWNPKVMNFIGFRCVRH